LEIVEEINYLFNLWCSWIRGQVWFD